MIARALLRSLWLLAVLLPAPATADEAFVFAYLTREGDAYYKPHRAYTGLTLRDHRPAVDGARLAIKDSRIIGRALGVGFELVEHELAAGEDAVAAIRKIEGERGARAFVLDLPLEDVRAAARALGPEGPLLFNPRHRDDGLRQDDCSPALFHTIPSDAMLMDALAQFAKERGWTRILLLEGPAGADRTASDAFQAAARKFGLKIVDVRRFVLSNDPRVRDQTNIALLTGEGAYDLVFLADAEGEFGRYVPYQTYDARPVIGSEGLGAGAWHWTWERHGAPQLNQRFDKLAGRPMADEDWAAWAAVRSVVEAVARAKSTDVPTLKALLGSGEFTFDLYKGTPGSYRPWDRQLRQPVLLHTHNAVIARAPIGGFLHARNNLDTLGTDEPESRCRLR